MRAVPLGSGQLGHGQLGVGQLGYRRPPSTALWLLAASAMLFAGVEIALAVRTATEHRLLIASLPASGAGFVVVGAVAWARRPSNRTGPLLCVTGLLVLGAGLAGVGLPPVLDRFGLLLGETPIAAALQIVIAFPSGRIPGRFDRHLVIGLYAAVLLRQLPPALSLDGLEGLRVVCSLVGTAILVVAAVRLARRVRRTPPDTAERRVLGVVYGYGMGLLLFLPFSARILGPLLHFDAVTLGVVQAAGFAVLPVVFAAGIFHGGFTRTGELADLAAWLGSRSRFDHSLRDLLASVLGDPSLEVWFRPAAGGVIDPQGRVADIVDSPRRGSVRVVGPNGLDAGVTLGYDRTLFGDPLPVEQAGQVLAVALERERLRAELLAEQEALRASRALVIETSDQQRRRLAQDLHDVLQSRLTTAALLAGRLALASSEESTRRGLVELRSDLDTLITEFRQVVHGVMPALLLERGLPAAAEDLVDRLPIPARLELDGDLRIPPVVATHSYFILAETLTNAVKHSRASKIEVRIAQHHDQLQLCIDDDGVGGAIPSGAGLRGIAQRVEALEGQFCLDSPVGRGTRVEVELPCGS